MIFNLLFCMLLLLIFFSSVVSVPNNGKWDFTLGDINYRIVGPRSLFKKSEIFIQISCQSAENSNITVEWILIQSRCWGDYLNIGDDSGRVNISNWIEGLNSNHENDFILSSKQYRCSDHIILDESHMTSSFVSTSLDDNKNSNSAIVSKEVQLTKPHTEYKNSVYTIIKDGVYLLILNITSRNHFRARTHVELKGDYGYLSAKDWPLLPFYGAMCIVYIVFAVLWLIVSFSQWRDLLRIQFWIGAVILIGMIEKAMFYEEYQSINSTGESSLLGTVFIAEFVSVCKRTLARILVIIVSLGYGIVKPRLGSHLPKILSTGIMYFILATVEAYLRISGPINLLLIASIPLALLDSFICWWIFSSLIQTTRTLRLRRNLVKLTLYNHFTNALIFAVIASAIYMLYAIKEHKIAMCFTDWKELWVDDAYWHLLFSIILLVIMVLWRPTNNNQRYAFSPLLDAPEDDDDDDEEVEHFVNDSHGVKMRGMGSNRSESPRQKFSNIDEDLKWVEENIPPSFIDSTLPILDSDEEIMNTKFEMSKME